MDSRDTKATNPASPTPAERQQPSFRRRTWQGVKFVAGGPVAALGIGDMRKGAGFIGSCVTLLRQGRGNDQRLVANSAGFLDLSATADRCNLTSDGLRQLIQHRRKQTVAATYLTGGFGLLSIATWFILALQMPMMSSRVVSAIEFLPFCLMFFLVAFKNAWTNWQLRTLRLGSAMEYLSTTEPFLPS